MRAIRKGSEPAEFIAWKATRQRTWDELDETRNRPRKQKSKDSLLEEQGYLCCYCCRRIKVEQSHIEHLAPRGKYPGRQLDYANLLASCQGAVGAPHCGHKKGDREIAITPLQGDCADHFRYAYDGQILPNAGDRDGDKRAADTISKLGLDVDKLNELRRHAIRAGLGLMIAKPPTRQELRRLYAHYARQERKGTGELTPFLPALLYILRQLLSREIP